ncbi:plastocyanin/azurin family copper-binding protein [Roseisolibacter sp. H3M3-2]|uniref:plastocyanin/azurin family copper-binding protein n=1 Tax=Roseisolibacter sp. H3M3-2 TaxID=3031323 RepID=UPI0023DAC88D|nr:plastocyanin/azurin family copper-binding protein [Roseisolibacter sp. H3M3-2]MDF1504649.1 plastocyanin/azurin family copper-binding protein [Roseisolibacter sp. H3M3-2]
MLRSLRTAPLPLALVALLAACGGEAPAPAPSSEPAAQQQAPASGGEQTPDAGGRVITVEMATDDAGNNVFRPAEVSARPGDVVRYTLVSGVHNVHFVADSSPGVSGLPKAGDMLQLQGQTWDFKVALPAGRYFFQCDPHALLGMVGHLTVAP